MKNLYKILAFGVILSFWFPLIKIGSTTSVKPDWIFMLFINGVILLNVSKFIKEKINIYFYVLFGLITISTIISNYFAGYYYMPAGGNFRPPMTLFLILNKISVFTFFFYIVSKGFVKIDSFIKFISIVFIVSLCFGIFQFFDLFGARQIALSYFLDEGGVQEHVFTSANRIIGTSPAVISWGGCSVLIFHYFIFIEKRYFYMISGSILASLNVIGTASRASLFALLASLILIFLIKAVVINKNGFSIIKVLIYCLIIFLTAFNIMKIYIPDQVEFLQRRIENTEEHMTSSGRGEQMNYFKTVLSQDPVGYLFGVGDSVIVDYGYLEVDYAYVFVAFGVFGFIFHYLLIGLLLKSSFHLRNFKPNYFLFCWGGTIGYLIFSIGFYFFYELYMGLPFWWLNGLVLGELYRSNNLKNKIKHNLC